MSPIVRMRDPRYEIQQAAKKAVLRAFKKHSRCQLIMACGSGKTFASLLIAESGRYKKIVILMPSLALVEQVLREYRECASWNKWEPIAVCSDPTVANDEVYVSPDEVGCEVTTERERVVEFLNGSGVRIVFCTYQSAEVLEGLNFELGIFDEAHKTAGRRDKAFAYALSDENVKIEHRLFMTATPKHVKIKNENGDSELAFSMDDEKTYGPIAYRLSFRQAINQGIICDYEIVVCPLLEDVNTSGYKPAQVALRKAMVNFGSAMAITFHSSVARAKEFAADEHKLFACPKWHVNGKMSTADRKKVLQGMIEQGGVVTNVRCLSEGVDFPTVDMVGFIDSKKSDIDIIQAVGRCLRVDRNSGKNKGFILVPVYIAQGETDDEAIAKSRFKSAYQIIQAIKEQDELFAEELVRAALVGGDGPARIRIQSGDEPASVSVEELNRAIMVRLVHGASWVNSVDVNKKKLLEMADRGDGRPSCKSTVLGRGLRNYTSQRSNSYDPDFDREIRHRAPYWFIDTVDENKRALLAMVDRGEKRPNSVRTRIGAALRDYTGQKSRCYDPDFDRKIRRLAPHWFVNTAAENKKVLLEMADRGEERPVDKIKLGKCLNNYICSRSSTYDPDFDREIRRLAPHWFVNTVAENKKVLLEMADRKESRPNRNTKFGSALREYTRRNGHTYDSDFNRKIRCQAPHWFSIDTAAENKRILLEMADRKEKRPNRHMALSRYTSQKSRCYDPDFDRKIRRLAPHWFVNTATENKKMLLGMVDRGEGKPSRKTKLGNRLGHYVNSNCCCYDPDFDREIRRRAPHWFDGNKGSKK